MLYKLFSCQYYALFLLLAIGCIFCNAQHHVAGSHNPHAAASHASHAAAAPHVTHAASSHAGSGAHNDQQPPQAPLAAAQQPQHRSSYNLLSEAMSQAVSNEFNSPGSGSADGACHADDLDCYSGSVQDRFGMEAIASLHRQLDDDDNGNIDLSESDDFLREELKYDSGYEKRQKAFHFNDDMHISVKELWEAWLRSEVHNWTIEQTTDWLAQSVQLPQYVELFKLHKVTGAALPRLAVNNLHYVSNVLGIKDPIHKQKISLKAMDVVLFGPPRETGTRWKDYILVTLLLSAIIGCWYAYQQNKNAKRHLRRMAQDMEGLQRAEQSLQEMQKELERARMEQENVATEKMDLERRLKEAPSLSATSSDLEVQKLKKEVEMLRSELSRAEFELVDNCWAPPPQLQSWLQYTYELESKNHQKKRVSAEKQLQTAREACEKLRKKRSSLVGAFVSTHGKSIDDVDRSIVEARNSLGEVTNELQERLHRWKQIETCLGLNIVNNNGLPYLESVLYGRNGASSVNSGSTKGSRARITSSTDDLDDESVQGVFDNYRGGSSLNAGGGGGGIVSSSASIIRDDSSCSDDGIDNQSVQFFLGSAAPTTPAATALGAERMRSALYGQATMELINGQAQSNAHAAALNDSHALSWDNGGGCGDSRHSPSASSERSVTLTVPPRSKKPTLAITASATAPVIATAAAGQARGAPLPPPRKSNQSQMLRSQSTDMVPMEIYTYLARPPSSAGKALVGVSATPAIATVAAAAAAATQQQQQQQFLLGAAGLELPTPTGARITAGSKKMVKQHSTASQQSTSSTSSSVQSAPPNADCYRPCNSQHTSPARWPSYERVTGAGHGYLFHGPGSASTIATSGLSASTLASSSTMDADSLSLQSDERPRLDKSNSTNELGHNNGNIKQQALKQLAAIVPALLPSDEASRKSGELKKRKRRLRFPFGSSSGNNNNEGSRKSSSNESGKSKFN